MKLEKAIEILELSKAPDFEGDSNDFYEAIELGIEALKLVKAQRGHRWVDAPKPLPGEDDA